MALTFKLDERQMEELRQQHREQVQASRDLSDNLSKWLALLVATLSGEGEDVQERLNQSAARLKSSTDLLDAAIQQHEGD